MILTSPLSRHNRSHQTWTSGHSNQHQQQPNLQHGSLKRAPPAQQPPKPPTTVPNGSLAAPFRSHTLNRFDLQQRRQANSQLQRLPVEPPLPISNGLPQANGYQAKRQQIYAPASIASPAELAHYKRPIASQPRQFPASGPELSRHYAATSYREPPPPPHSTYSESGRSGRDSALGYLLERFGTLRRRAKWSKLTARRSSSAVPPSHYGESTVNRAGSPASFAQTDLDEIYAKTGGAGSAASQKKRPEAEEIYAEGLRAIDGNGQKRLIEHQLDESIMSEGETRHLILEESQRQPDYQLLVSQLTNWINDELAQQRIVITDLQEDLYDGQILGKLIEKLHQLKLDVVEVTQNEITQKYKLKMVLDTINRILSLQARWARLRWSVEGIHSKNMVEILQLLVTLSLHYRAPIQLPANVHVRVLKVQKSQGQLVQSIREAQLTCKHEAEMSALVLRNHQLGHLNGASNQSQRDAFDTLCEFAPDKLIIVKRSLVNFVNRHLNKINMSCLANRVQDVLDPDQFSDGLLLVFLMAALEDYFVPLGNLFTAPPPTSARSHSSELSANNALSSITGLQTALEPTSYTNTLPIHKLHNVNVALQLMEEAGIAIRDKVRAEDIVNGDLKTILRVLYALFSRYKHL